MARRASWVETPADERGSKRLTVPTDRVIFHIRQLMAVTGDNATMTAWGLELDADWTEALLQGAVTELTVDEVRQVCEGFACTPVELLGPDVAQTILCEYGPDQWPKDAEPLGD